MAPTFDADWRARALRGDGAAVQQMADTLLEPLYRFCLYRVGRNRHLCEEVVQETIVRALRDLDHYDPPRANNNIFPWITGLARNEIHRVLNRERHSVSLEALWARMDRELLALYARLDSEPFADELLLREETRELVNATMSQLPPHYREALEAKYVTGKSVRDLAALWRTTEKAVESQLTRARKAFRATFLVLTRNLEPELPEYRRTFAMTDNHLPPGTAPDAPDVVEQNLERLLGRAYKPEVPDADFAQRLRERLAVAARERARATAPPRRLPILRRRLIGVLAAAAAIAGLAFLYHVLTTPAPQKSEPIAKNEQPQQDEGPLPRKALPAPTQTPAAQQIAHLTPRERPEPPPAAKLAVGASLRTGSGERRRVTLPDGSVLYLNQKTEVKLDAERHVTLSAGEVFVEVAPRSTEHGDAARFVVKTPQREVVALGTKFDVAALDGGTGVTVTQGQVRVSDLDDVLSAGQQLAPDAQRPTAAPRAAAALDWTRELMCAAEAPLIPPSKYTGGALVINDPSGQAAHLSLRKYHVDVHVEDGFARTTIDQTYFNHTLARLEGTFYFPLPQDASLSRLAMYVNGQLMEGGMAERDFARQTFENIVRRMQDPALLEWVDGSTFKMRVFPLEARQEKRIVLSYTQRLPVQYGRASYRFPAGHSLEAVRDWSFHATVKGGAALTWASDTHADLLTATTEKGDLLLDAKENNVKVDRDVALDLFDGGKRPRGDESARFSSMDHDGGRYFMVRYRPELPADAQRRHRDWVFLFESSGDRDPLLARTQIDVIRTLLANAEHDDTFAIVTAGTRPGTFAQEAKPVTADNVTAALKFLEGTHLVGALDLGKALAAAEPFLKSAQNAYLVHVGSGLPALGERNADVLAKRVPDGVHYVGVGVGKHWSRALMKAAAERSGGFFTQINPDEPVNWRSFELYSALTAPRLLGVKVVDDAEKATFLTHTSAVAQGEEVCAIARLDGGAKLPESVTVTGTLDGQTFHRAVPVKDVVANAGYLPRTWAKLEIDRLLAENAQANKARLVQLSMASYVMTPFTSLLVLENDAMYAQYGVDRGRKDHWAMYPCPEKIGVVYEPLDGMAAAPKPAAVVKPGAAEVMGTILVRVPPQTFAEGTGVPAPRAVTVRDLYLGAFAVPVANGPAGFPTDGKSNGQVFNFWMGYFDGGGQGGGVTATARDPRWDVKPGEVPPAPSLPPVTPVAPTQVVSGGGPASAPVAGPVVGGPGPGFGGMMPPPGAGGFNINGGLGGIAGFGGGGGGFGIGSGFGGGGFPGQTSATTLPYSGTMPTAKGWPGPTGYYYTPAGLTQYAPTYASPTGQWAGSGPAPGTPYSPMLLPGYGNGLPAGSPRTGTGDLEMGLKRLDEETKQRMRLHDGMKEAEPLDQLEARLRLLQQLDRTDVTLQKKMIEELDKVKDKKGVKSRITLDDDEVTYLARRLASIQAQRGVAPPVVLGGARPDALLYHPPAFAPDGRLFTDLIAYAPGLNTNSADVLGVLEAEAATNPADAPGAIEPAARDLIEGARAAGWRTLTVPAASGAPAWAVAFDGSGRYAYDRVLSSGLREHVICDGKELLHLYSELGLGARRTVTRFHRAELGDLVPWALPPVKDLAHGFDLKCVGEHTVALVPVGLKADQPAVIVHLVFADDGRLAERRLVEMPKDKALRRETYGADGTVRVFDGEGKDLSTRKLALKAGGAPDLDPDTKDVIVLPLPLRTVEHVVQPLPVASRDINTMDRTSLLAFVAAYAAMGDPAQVEAVIRARFWNLGDNRPGTAALLLSASQGANAVPAMPNGKAPLSRYVEWLQGNKPAVGPKPDGLLARLTEVQALRRRWQQPGALSAADCARMVKYVRESKLPVFAWAVVTDVLRTPEKKVVAEGGRAKVQRDVLQAATEALKDVPGLSYAARYEYARHLADHGERAEARELFVALYEETAKAGTLPPLDGGFRLALKADGQEPDLFAKLLRDRAAGLVKDGRRVAAVALAWQCWELEAPALADELLSAALDGIADRDRRAAPTFAALEYLAQTHQHDRADKLLRGLLADETFAKYPGLWRLGYQLALQHKQPARAFSCLAEALELEYRAHPEWIDVAAVRLDYAALLAHYAEVVRAAETLGQKAPADLAAKVVRAADRWRALDVDGSWACLPAYQGLRGLGEPDLAWDYLVMGSHVNTDGFAWLNMAQSLQLQEDFDMAERAYEQACAAAPGNADLLRARADNLLQAGHAAEGRDLLRRLGDAPPPAPPPTKPVAPERKE